MKTIIGNWARPDGTAAAGAILTLLLSQDAAGDVGQIGHYPVTITLDDDGAIPFQTSIGGFLLETNDELLPAGTYYTVTVKDPVFGQIYLERLVISGAEPINLNLIVPAAKGAPAIPTNNIMRLRTSYTVLQADVDAGAVTVPMNWQVAFADTNYTFVLQLQVAAGKELVYYINAASKTSAGVIAGVGVETGAAGDILVINAFAIHD